MSLEHYIVLMTGPILLVLNSFIITLHPLTKVSFSSFRTKFCRIRPEKAAETAPKAGSRLQSGSTRLKSTLACMSFFQWIGSSVFSICECSRSRQFRFLQEQYLFLGIIITDIPIGQYNASRNELFHEYFVTLPTCNQFRQCRKNSKYKKYN